MHRSINYCRVFTELAETFIDTIIEGSADRKDHYAIKILDLVLICLGHHDYEVSNSYISEDKYSYYIMYFWQ